MYLKVLNRITKSLIFIFLIISVIPIIFPLIWMVVTSITPEKLFYQSESIIFLPSEIRTQNFIDAFTLLPFHRFFMNTISFSTIATFGSLLSCTFVAYGFARYEFRKKNVLFWFLLGTMILPGVVLMVPMFLIFNFFGWIDTYYPLTVPAFFGIHAGTVLILRQRIRTIPSILFQAGNIEGFSTFHSIRFIILPEILPILGTLGVLHFIGHWNDLMGPLIYINSFEKKTLSLGLTYFQSQFSTNITLMMAASLVVAIPTIIIFFINQKNIIRGINLLGEVKR